MTAFHPERLPHLQNEDGSIDRELLLELVGLFLETTPPKVVELNASMAARDARAVEKTAHFIKGSCAQMGLEELRALLAGMEAAARGEDWIKIVELQRGLEVHLAGAYECLQKVRDGGA